ncbi:MAG: hypothetical protein RO009_20185 [Pseudorhodoplanes sp.]|nr:hypothetical protein [Pseudorhodoplanes sp.]
MLNTLSGPELRRYAMRCRAQADNPACSEEERKRLMEMQVAFLTLAETADWLSGKSGCGEPRNMQDGLSQDRARELQATVRPAAAAMK